MNQTQASARQVVIPLERERRKSEHRACNHSRQRMRDNSNHEWQPSAMLTSASHAGGRDTIGKLEECCSPCRWARSIPVSAIEARESLTGKSHASQHRTREKSLRSSRISATNMFTPALIDSSVHALNNSYSSRCRETQENSERRSNSHVSFEWPTTCDTHSSMLGLCLDS